VNELSGHLLLNTEQIIPVKDVSKCV